MKDNAVSFFFQVYKTVILNISEQKIHTEIIHLFILYMKSLYWILCKLVMRDVDKLQISRTNKLFIKLYSDLCFCLSFSLENKKVKDFTHLLMNRSKIIISGAEMPTSIILSLFLVEKKNDRSLTCPKTTSFICRNMRNSFQFFKKSIFYCYTY